MSFRNALRVALLAGAASVAGITALSVASPAASSSAAPPGEVATTSTTPAPAAAEPARPAPPTSSTAAPATPSRPPGLRPGDSGPAVRALQERLRALRFWLGRPDGTYGELTAQAVLAFQKAHGLPRDGVAGSATLSALERAATPKARTRGGDAIEIDLRRQLLLVVRGGRTVHVLNTSTGRRGAWETPAGRFTVQRQVDGVRRAPLGELYRPKYFNGGIAVHGAERVPGQPASHGCARLSDAAMDLLWSGRFAEVGTAVWVY